MKTGWNNMITKTLQKLWIISLASLYFRESDGSFQYGYYWREADDLHAVTQHFNEANRVVSAVVGHSKGILTCSLYQQVFLSTRKMLKKICQDSI